MDASLDMLASLAYANVTPTSDSSGSDSYTLMANVTSHPTRLMERFEVKILFGFIMGTLCLITTVGNICVIYKYRKTVFVGNLFIMSLAVADLIVGAFVMPMATIYAITDVWIMTLPVCQVWLSADYIASTASILNLLTLSLDRYWSITSPLEYLGKRTKSRALCMISFAWCVSFLWIFPITGWSYVFNNGVRVVPADKCNTEYDKKIIFKITTAICNFYIPLIAMISINTKIYMVIKKRYHSPIMRYTSGTPLNKKMYGLGGGGGGAISSNKPATRQNSISESNAVSVNPNSKKSFKRAPNSFSYSSSFKTPNSRHTAEITNGDLYMQQNISSTSNKLQQHQISLTHNLASQRQHSSSSTSSNFFSCLTHHFHNLLPCFASSARPVKKTNNNVNANSLATTPHLVIARPASCTCGADAKPLLFTRSSSQLAGACVASAPRRCTVCEEARLLARKNYANRQIPSDSASMSRLVYHEAKFTLDKEDSLSRLSPVFSRTKRKFEPSSKQSSDEMEEKGADHPLLETVIEKAAVTSDSVNVDDHVKKLEEQAESTAPVEDPELEKRLLEEASRAYIMSLKADMKVVPKQMNKQEKAFKQLLAIVIGFTLCFMPYFIVFLIVAICEDCVSEDVFTMTVWLGYFNSTLNPFLYAMNSKQKFFGKSKKKPMASALAATAANKARTAAATHHKVLKSQSQPVFSTKEDTKKVTEAKSTTAEVTTKLPGHDVPNHQHTTNDAPE